MLQKPSIKLAPLFRKLKADIDNGYMIKELSSRPVYMRYKTYADIIKQIITLVYHFIPLVKVVTHIVWLKLYQRYFDKSLCGARFRHGGAISPCIWCISSDFYRHVHFYNHIPMFYFDLP